MSGSDATAGVGHAKASRHRETFEVPEGAEIVMSRPATPERVAETVAAIKRRRVRALKRGEKGVLALLAELDRG